jgi:hypothetical protein
MGKEAERTAAERSGVEIWQDAKAARWPILTREAQRLTR